MSDMDKEYIEGVYMKPSGKLVTLFCYLGLHDWLCDFTDTKHPKLLLQFFRCSRCCKQKPYCGFITFKSLESK